MHHSFFYPPVTRKMIRLGCYLTSLGCVDYPPNTPYPCKGHPQTHLFRWNEGRVIPEYALVLITAGAGTFEADEVPLARLTAGDAFYLVPGAWHRYRPDTTTGWSERWLTLNGALLHQFRNSSMVPGHAKLLKIGDPDKVIGLLQGLLDEVSKAPEKNKPTWGMRALEVLFQAFEDAEAPEEFSLPEHQGDAILVCQALDYIRDNCHRPLTVGSVAAYCATSRRTLERHFFQNGGNSVAQQIVLSRIERAEMLLGETHMSVKEIAYACGFGSTQRMIYSFHRNRGCTPSSLRRN